MTTIQTTGFIVTDANQTVIWSTGATEDAAWAAFDANAQHVDGTRDDFRTVPATAALLAEVTQRGGAIAWGNLGTQHRPIACTVAEEDA